MCRQVFSWLFKYHPKIYLIVMPRNNRSQKRATRGRRSKRRSTRNRRSKKVVVRDHRSKKRATGGRRSKRRSTHNRRSKKVVVRDHRSKKRATRGRRSKRKSTRNKRSKKVVVRDHRSKKRSTRNRNSKMLSNQKIISRFKKHSILDKKIRIRDHRLNILKGIPQSDLKVPFTNASKASDIILYNDHAGTGKLYIPRYKIDVHRISGNQQFKIELSEATDGEGGFLKVSLEQKAADEIKNKLNGASAMDHDTELALRFTVPGTSIDKRVPFTEIVKTEAGIDATMRVTTFNEFNQIFAAISNSEYECRLELLRSVKVAIPRFSDNRENTAKGQKPILVCTKRVKTDIRGTKFTRIHLSIRNWNAFPNALFRPSPELPPCGRNKKASRTWVEIYNGKGKKLYGYCAFGKNENLQNFSFAVKVGKPLPKTCYVVLWDRKANKKYTSNKVKTHPVKKASSLKAGEKVYKVVSEKFQQNIPFHFPESRHSYIYRNSGNRDTVSGGFKPFRIQWDQDGSDHVYLQEEVNPENFFYLPDHYRLAREDAPIFSPKLSAELSGDRLEDLQAEISYQAEAYVDPERLEDAFVQLTNHDEITGQDITFKPLIVSGDQLTYKLSLPGAGGFKKRPDSLLSLESIQDTLPAMPLEDFESLFEVLTNDSSSSSMFTGRVEADIPGIPLPPVPVSIRLTQVDPEMLAIETTENSNFKVEVKNVTSRTLSAQGVVITIQDGESTFTGSKAGLKLPLKLAPGETTTFAVIPDVELEKPDDAFVGLLWEGMQQHGADGSVSDTPGSFSIINQRMTRGETIHVTNPIEGVLKIDGVRGFIQRENEEIPLVIKNLPRPVELAPGESFSFDIIASEDVDNYELSDIFFDWQGLRSEPDKEQLFDSIVDTSVQATYQSEIKVSLFIDPISQDSVNRLLKVEFKNSADGPLVEELIFTGSDFTNSETDHVEKNITLPLPIKKFILGAASSGQYWYRIILIKETDGGGDTTESAPLIGEWKSKSGSLEITTSLLPSG